MKKITVNKSDEVSVIVEKMIEAEDDEITLSVPRFSHIGESLSNFYLLKRESDALNKKVSIESVDDKVIELASMSGLLGTNPFFAKNRRQFSDIVAPRSASRSGDLKSGTGRLIRKEIASEMLSSREPNSNFRRKTSADEDLSEGTIPAHSVRTDFPTHETTRKPLFKMSSISLPNFEMPSMNFSGTWGWVLAGIIIVSITGYAAAKILPSAEVKIVAQKKDWSYTDAIIADKAAVSDIKAMSIPAQVFTEQGNSTNKFPATGRKQVEKYAAGAITVFNSYSSDQQQLVETTRFMAPDGKIFRLAKTIMVPGAKIVDGKIVPSSISANIIAAAPGPDYNIGPVKLFTIPGFKGGPKFQSFYAESSSDMAGGFIGEVAYPTADDVSKAKTQTASDIESALNAKLFSQVPKEFKILEGSHVYRILSQKADAEADKDGNFGVLTDAKSIVIAFKESDAQDLLKNKALAESNGDFEVRSIALDYAIARADFDKGRITFPVTFKTTLARKIGAEELKSKIAGKSETELKTMIFALPGLESATISLWPFWVKHVPTSLNKIKVVVD